MRIASSAAEPEVRGTTRCYARQDKFWVEAPDSERWEIYSALADKPHLLRPAASGRSAGRGDEQPGHPHERGRDEPVVDPDAAALAVDDPGFAQNFQVVADGRLGEVNAAVRSQTQASPPWCAPIKDTNRSRTGSPSARNTWASPRPRPRRLAGGAAGCCSPRRQRLSRSLRWPTGRSGPAFIDMPLS